MLEWKNYIIIRWTKKMDDVIKNENRMKLLKAKDLYMRLIK